MYTPENLDASKRMKSTVKQQTRTNSTPFHIPPSVLLDQKTGHVRKTMCTTRSKIYSKMHEKLKA